MTSFPCDALGFPHVIRDPKPDGAARKARFQVGCLVRPPRRPHAVESRQSSAWLGKTTPQSHNGDMILSPDRFVRWTGSDHMRTSPTPLNKTEPRPARNALPDACAEELEDGCQKRNMTGNKKKTRNGSAFLVYCSCIERQPTQRHLGTGVYGTWPLDSWRTPGTTQGCRQGPILAICRDSDDAAGPASMYGD